MKIDELKKFNEAIDRIFELSRDFQIAYEKGRADGLREGLDDNPDRGSSWSPKRKRKVKA
jgi:hypothetical protein